MAGPTTSDPGTQGPANPSARHRLNLIDQITEAAVASDYAGQQPRGRRAGSRRQQVLVAAIALGLAGFVLALGVSARILNTPVVTTQRQALIDRIDTADQQGSALVAEAVLLRLEVAAAREDSLRLTAQGRVLDQSITELELVTGYTAVEGGGAVVTLTDAPPVDEPLEGGSQDADLERVLDSDLQLAVNGLWASGAEAISVNGQRLTAQSAIRSAASAILVNYRPLKPPYRVEAIGPGDLAERFAATADAARLQAVSEQFRIGWEASAADQLVLRPATAPLPTQAQVVPSEEGGAP